MKILYWAPWIGNVGTIKAKLIHHLFLVITPNKKFQSKIIDAVGEWSSVKFRQGNFINLSKFKIISFYPRWIFKE